MGNSCIKSADSTVMNPTSATKENTSTSAIVVIKEPVGGYNNSTSPNPSRPQTSSKSVSDIEIEIAAGSKNDSLDPSRPQTSSKDVSNIDNTAGIKLLSPSPSQPRVGSSLSASLSTLSISQPPKKKLIILAGDATDADGCIEFAMLAKENVDLLYLMHISHPYGVSQKDNRTFESIHAEAIKTGLPFPGMCKAFNDLAKPNARSYNYSTEKSSDELVERCQFTFEGIFEEFKKNSGSTGNLFFRYRSPENLYFYNRLNPFGFVWGSEHKTFTEDFNPPHATGQPHDSSPLPNLEDYSEVLFDISGSTAFWESDPESKAFILKANGLGLLKYVVVMGSVVTTEEPKTLAVAGALIRHPMATMNQLYDPQSFTDISATLSDTPKWVVVTNNAVNDVASYTTYESQPAFVDFIVDKVLQYKKEDCPMLVKVLDHFYKVESKFKWKLFDCLTGKIICDYLKTGQLVSAANTGGPSASTAMFTESGQGVTVVGPIETLKGYVEKLGLEATEKQVFVENVFIPSFNSKWYEN